MKLIVLIVSQAITVAGAIMVGCNYHPVAGVTMVILGALVGFLEIAVFMRPHYGD